MRALYLLVGSLLVAECGWSQLAEQPYSFCEAPFIHPRIVQALTTWLSDTGDQVISINLPDCQKSDRFYGDINIYTESDACPSVRCGEENDWFEYQYIGQTGSGVHILTHDYFTKMKTYMSTRIPFLRIDGKERKACLIDFLLIKYRIFYEVTAEFCLSDAAADTADRGDKWVADFTEMLLDGVAAYEKEALEAGIPAIFLTCFNTHHSIRLTQCWDFMTSLAKSKYFPSNARRTEVMLDMLVVIFNATLIDAERTMDELNGELDEALVDYPCM